MEYYRSSFKIIINYNTLYKKVGLFYLSRHSFPSPPLSEVLQKKEPLASPPTFCAKLSHQHIFSPDALSQVWILFIIINLMPWFSKVFLHKKRNQEIIASSEEEAKLRRGEREGAFEIVIREAEKYQ